MSQQAGFAKHFTSDTEQPVRPKVMRRPSHFSQKGPALTNEPAFLTEKHDDALDLSQPPASVPMLALTPAAKAWQDDARFGAVMLAVVVIVNVALMLWLPHIRPIPNKLPDALVTSETAVPTVQPDEPLSPVTLYTKPVTQTDEPVVHILGDEQ